MTLPRSQGLGLKGIILWPLREHINALGTILDFLPPSFRGHADVHTTQRPLEPLGT
jgi:hypothetical protein